MNKRKPARLGQRVLSVLLSTVCSLALLPTADAAPKLRYQIDQRGDMLLFGNTVGYDCRPGIPAPMVGDIDMANCGLYLTDSSADVWWRSDEPSMGRAAGNTTITNAMARSTAMLELPAGAQIT